jgi:ATP-dependent DNA helicase RecQ
MFSGFVPINEEDLSRKSAASRDTIYKYLVKLSSFNIIRYIPGKKTALVIFKEERLERKSLLISPENYLHVKKRYEERLFSMIEFAESVKRCRSSVLLDYFGEESGPCGNCDVCSEKKSKEPDDNDANIEDEIKQLINEKNPDAEELVRLLDHPEEKLVMLIRNMLDRNIIIQDDSRRLILNKKKK